MVRLLKSQTISVSVAHKPAEVYDFVSNPENLPSWAKGLARQITKSGSGWIIQTPQGLMTFRFAPRNDLGVLDHFVKTSDGVEIYVPMRVFANQAGSEVAITVFRQPGVTDDVFAEDLRQVEADLQTLKEILEQGKKD